MAFWLNSVGHYQAGRYGKAEKSKKTKPPKPRAGLPVEAFVFQLPIPIPRIAFVL
jgi:hypothetical protein